MDFNHDLEAMQNRIKPELGEPFLEKTVIKEESSREKSRGKESIAYVFISTLVVAAGSYEFGSCVSQVYLFHFFHIMDYSSDQQSLTTL